MNITKQKTKLGILALCGVSLVACGHDDGDTSMNPAYIGLTNEAVIDRAYLDDLLSDLNTSNASNTAEPAPVAVNKQSLQLAGNSNIQNLIQNKLLSQNFKNKSVAFKTSAAQIPSAIDCGVSGSYTSTMENNPETNEFSDVTIYSECKELDGSIKNGEISTYSKSDAANPENNIFSNEYVNYSVQDSFGYIVENGSFKFVGDKNEKMTADLVREDKNKKVMTYEKDSTSISITSATDISITLSAKYYHSSFGFVSIATVPNQPITIDTTAFAMYSGQIIVTGNHSSFTITYLADNNFILEADYDGDGISDIIENCNFSRLCNITSNP